MPPPTSPLQIPMSPWDHVYNMLLASLKDVINPVWFFIGILSFMFSISIWITTILFKMSLIPEIDFQILGQDDIKMYQKVVKWSSSKGPSGKPNGFAFGSGFIGYIREPLQKWESRRMSVLCIKTHHDRICGNNTKKNDKNDVPENYTCWQKIGVDLKRVEYGSEECDITEMNPKPFQQKIIEVILKIFDEKSFVSVIITGHPGCGKSMISDLLIKHFAKQRKIRCNYTDDFRFDEAGDSWKSMWKDVCTEDNPMIVDIDEIDTVLKNISGEGIRAHDKLRICVRNKSGWSKMFNRIDKKRYKNLILIMTSNCDLEEIDKIDQSLLRPNRINIRCVVRKDGTMTIQVSSEDGLGWCSYE